MSIRVFFVTPACSANAAKLKRRSMRHSRRLFTRHYPLSLLYLFYTLLTPVSIRCNIGIRTNGKRPAVIGRGSQEGTTMAQQMETRKIRPATPERWQRALQRALFAGVEAK